MSIKDIDIDESQSGGKTIVLRYGWWDPFYMIAGVGLWIFFEALFKYQSIQNYTLFLGALIVSILCLVAALIRRKRSIIFNDNGISVNGDAVIPWKKIDEVVLLDGDSVDWYKFRYRSYDGKTRYLTIPDYMTNMQEAIKFAGKKLPGKFGDKFSPKPKSPPPVYTGGESDYTTDYQDVIEDVIEDIDEGFSDNFSQKQKTPSDFYIDGEIVMRRFHWAYHFLWLFFICFALFMYICMPAEHEILYGVLMFAFFWLVMICINKKVIFCNAGIIEKSSKPLISWDNIYEVDTEHWAYVFKYTSHDWGEHSIKLPFRMTNMRKGIEAAKKKLPELF